MKTGLYRLVICRKISANGLPIDHIEFNKLDHTELETIKESAISENWHIYCQGELTKSELKVLN